MFRKMEEDLGKEEDGEQGLLAKEPHVQGPGTQLRQGVPQGHAASPSSRLRGL